MLGLPHLGPISNEQHVAQGSAPSDIEYARLRFQATRFPSNAVSKQRDAEADGTKIRRQRLGDRSSRAAAVPGGSRPAEATSQRPIGPQRSSRRIPSSGPAGHRQKTAQLRRNPNAPHRFEFAPKRPDSTERRAPPKGTPGVRCRGERHSGFAHPATTDEEPPHGRPTPSSRNAVGERAGQGGAGLRSTGFTQPSVASAVRRAAAGERSPA
jgi:hypothetical protein